MMCYDAQYMSIYRQVTFVLDLAFPFHRLPVFNEKGKESLTHGRRYINRKKRTEY